MYGRMFHEESDEVEKYVGGLPDMIRGNVIQAEQKRKLKFNAGNNQGHQQQNKRQNTGRAYTAGPGEKREYTGSLPLCIKCNYHHKGPCAPRCNKCKKIGYLARDYRSSGPNGNNNNRGNSGTTQNAGTCYECGVQGHFKRDCLKLKNKNRGNQGGNGNAPAKVYVVGNAGTNPDSNVGTGTFLLNNRYASILFDTGANRSFVSTTFSSLIDITPTTLDHYYDVELANGKIRHFALSFDFVFMSGDLKSLSFILIDLPPLRFVSRPTCSMTLHLLESSLIISLDRLDILKEDLVYQSLRNWNENPKIKQLAINRVDEYGFVIRPDLVRLTSGSVGPFYNINTVLVIRTSQSRQHGKSESDSYYLSDLVVNSFTGTSLIHIESHHRFFPVDTSLIHIESRKSPTKSLFDVGSSRISIFTVNTLNITRMFWQNHKDNA
ncbi:putative reverse transcriptase domain-containing protein [Tanacetum coccineum]